MGAHLPLLPLALCFLCHGVPCAFHLPWCPWCHGAVLCLTAPCLWLPCVATDALCLCSATGLGGTVCPTAPCHGALVPWVPWVPWCTGAIYSVLPLAWWHRLPNCPVPLVAMGAPCRIFLLLLCCLRTLARFLLLGLGVLLFGYGAVVC